MRSEKQSSPPHVAAPILRHVVPRRVRTWLRQFDTGYHGLKERIRQLESALDGATSHSRHCVFVHVPRTAGTSIWHGLANAATKLRIRVCDLHNESVRKYGNIGQPHEVLRETLPLIGKARCLFHHHTARHISAFFRNDETVYTTLLRDPVDRFVSDAFHYKQFVDDGASGGAHSADYDVRNHVDPELSQDFLRALRQDGLGVREILEIAASEPYFSNYYVRYFWSICMNETVPDGGFRPGDVRALAAQIRRQFTVIGSFNDLQRSYARIMAAFGMGSGADRLERHVMKGRARPDLADAEKQRFEHLFELDYQLMDELNE